MLVSKILYSNWLAFNSAHEKFDVSTRPKTSLNLCIFKFKTLLAEGSLFGLVCRITFNLNISKNVNGWIIVSLSTVCIALGDQSFENLGALWGKTSLTISSYPTGLCLWRNCWNIVILPTALIVCKTTLNSLVVVNFSQTRNVVYHLSNNLKNSEIGNTSQVLNFNSFIRVNQILWKKSERSILH